MNQNIIKQSIDDTKLFLEEYPEKMIDKSAYTERMKQSIDFTGVIKQPKDSNTVETEGSLFTFEKIISMTEETIDLYEYLKKQVTENTRLSWNISSIYLESPGAYNRKTVNAYRSFDTIELGKINITSKITFILALAADLISAKKYTKEEYDTFKADIKSLFLTAASVFNPNVLGDLLASLCDIGVLNYIFDKEELNQFIVEMYECLVLAEGILIDNTENYLSDINVGLTTSDLVAYKLSRFVFKNPIEILDDKNHHNWYDTIFNPPAYNRYKKDLYTLILLDLVNTPDGRFNNGHEKYPAMDEANRYIRQSITDWIKHKDISERPDIPEAIRFINITPYLKNIYSHALWTMSDMNEYVDVLEAAKEETEKKYTEVKTTWDSFKKHTLENSESVNEEELHEELLASKEAKDVAYNEYLSALKHKSLIGFLFLEILSNEKTVAMCFNRDLIAFILSFEPGVDNSMHDTYIAVTSLYNKRDFQPLGVNAVNPFYIHAVEGDIIADESKKLAAIMSGLTNYNMGSRIACSFINTPVEAAAVISNVEYTTMRAKLTLSEIIKRLVESCKSAIDKIDTDKIFDEANGREINKLIQASLEDFDMNVPESRNNLIVVINNFLDKDTFNPDVFLNDSDQTETTQFAYMTYVRFGAELTNLKEAIISYDDTVWGESNIFNQINEIFTRLESEEAIVTANSDIQANKRQYSLWPRINQYEYPITDEEQQAKSKEETAHENFYDLEPGDLRSGRFATPYERLGDRYSTSKACD